LAKAEENLGVGSENGRVPLAYILHARIALELIKAALLYDKVVRRLIREIKIEKIFLFEGNKLKFTNALKITLRYKSLVRKVRILWWGASSRPFTMSDLRKRKAAFVAEENETVFFVSTTWIVPEAYAALKRLRVRTITLNHNFAPQGLKKETILRAYGKAKARWWQGAQIWAKKHPHLLPNRIPCQPPLLVNRFAFEKVLARKIREVVAQIRAIFSAFYPEILEWWRKYVDLIQRLKYAIKIESKSYERHVSTLIREHLEKWEDKPPPRGF